MSTWIWQFLRDGTYYNYSEEESLRIEEKYQEYLCSDNSVFVMTNSVFNFDTMTTNTSSKLRRVNDYMWIWQVYYNDAYYTYSAEETEMIEDKYIEYLCSAKANDNIVILLPIGEIDFKNLTVKVGTEIRRIHLVK